MLLLLGSASSPSWRSGIPTSAAFPDCSAKEPAKFHVFFEASHPQLPWTGVLTGLMVLHFYYWGTNQFMVQRALGAKTGWDGRMGIIAAGFFKLLIPFLCIVPGMAAGYILTIDAETQSDTTFAALTRALVPAGYGLVGLVMAGLVGGILSTIDSMMNSTATLFTFDIYQKYISPKASEQRLIWVGRVAMMRAGGYRDRAVAAVRRDEGRHLQHDGRLQRLPGAGRIDRLPGGHFSENT